MSHMNTIKHSGISLCLCPNTHNYCTYAHTRTSVLTSMSNKLCLVQKVNTDFSAQPLSLYGFIKIRNAHWLFQTVPTLPVT